MDRPAERRSKSKEKLAPEPVMEEQALRGRSPSSAVADRQSYKRWQMSAGKNNSESDSYV